MKTIFLLSFLGINALEVVAGCLSSTSSNPEDNYKACCLGGQRSGKETLDGVTYEYQCDATPASFQRDSWNSESAHECAKSCANSDKCLTAAWLHRERRCYPSATDRSTGASGFLFIKKGKRPPREDCEEKVRAAVSQCNQELRTCSNEKATLQKEIADLKDKVKPIPEPTKSENDRIIEEISQYSFPSLCPRFDGKTFQTVNRDGTKNEWHLICGANCNGRTWQWAFEWPCHTQNLIQLLREKQDQRDYHGVWLRMDGACNQQVSGGTPYCVPRPGNRHPWVRRTRAFFTD